jgi:hypothetical protein
MARNARKIARKPAKTTRPKSSGIPAAGPLTLEEAQAAVLATRPKLAAKTIRKTAAPPTSPAAVGAERKELKSKQQAEISRRAQEYTAVMRLLKKRGARAPASKTKGKTGAGKVSAKPAAFVPLQVMAEGDSWFDYPVPFFGGGIIPRLQTRLGVPILNLATAGDEVRYMLGVEQRKKLIKHLKNGCPAGGPWDLLLFSGGGNDIVGDPMALWVRQWDPSKPPKQHLIQSRLDSALTLVRAAYEDLIALRDELSPSTHIVFHAYDYAIPDGRGICHLGPWLKPTFDLRKFPSQSAAHEVVKSMIDQFAAMLNSLTQASGVSFINTPGTLTPVSTSWHNELHPSKGGFNLITDKIYVQLKAMFPHRVA